MSEGTEPHALRSVWPKWSEEKREGRIEEAREKKPLLLDKAKTQRKAGQKSGAFMLIQFYIHLIGAEYSAWTLSLWLIVSRPNKPLNYDGVQDNGSY